MINGTKEFQKMANDANKMMLESWSSWTKDTIQSDAFTSASGAFMDWSLATHKMMNELSGQFMESMDVPRRSDLARISSQVQSVETRILEQEEAQDDIKELLSVIVNKLDTMEQRKQEKPASPKAEKTSSPAKSEPKAEKAPLAEAESKAEKSEPTKATAKAKTGKATAKPAAKAKKTTSKAKKSKAKKASKSK